MHTTKIAGAAGLVWAVANVAIGMSSGSPPALDAGAADIRTFLADNRSVLLASALVFALTIPALLTFFGELIGRVRNSGDGTALAGATTGALGLFTAMFALSYTLLLPLVLQRSLLAGMDPSLLRFLWMATFLLTMIGNVAFGSLLLGLGLSPVAAGPRARVGAIAIGAVAIVVSAVGLVNVDVALSAGLGFLLLAVWMLVVSVGLLRAGRPATAAVPTAATT